MPISLIPVSISLERIRLYDDASLPVNEVFFSPHSDHLSKGYQSIGAIIAHSSICPIFFSNPGAHLLVCFEEQMRVASSVAASSLVCRVCVQTARSSGCIMRVDSTPLRVLAWLLTRRKVANRHRNQRRQGIQMSSDTMMMLQTVSNVTLLDEIYQKYIQSFFWCCSFGVVCFY